MHTPHFFLRPLIFSKTSRTLSSDGCFAIAAGVVQQLFLERQLVDNAFPRVLHEKLSAENWNRAAYCRKSFKIGAVAKNATWDSAERDLTNEITHAWPLSAYPCLPMPQSGTKGQNSFILIVCPAQTILSRSSTSQCPSALFNLTAAVVPRCTVFAHE